MKVLQLAIIEDKLQFKDGIVPCDRERNRKNPRGDEPVTVLSPTGAYHINFASNDTPGRPMARDPCALECQWLLETENLTTR
jgi:hypothetical protein